ncbi:MAG: hypothetical protein J5787_07200 [Alphaproteobacteria bacterium]|nr:hypothetical protein [Alphaproteobacteria bacterium]MBO4644692.1 hypothetical protein [Alphaproteobacteria bacterium]
MLILEKRIGLGAVRECYEHPTDKAKCVKVLLPHAGLSVFERELKNYTAVKDVLKDFVIPCEKELVETNKGPGMICDLITDDNGEISQMIFNYKKDAEVKEKLDAFAALLLTHKLFFYDFNMYNFVVQIKNGKKNLKYIDLKSFRRNKSWCFLKLENVFDFLARTIMTRRLKRLYRDLGIEMPETIK